MHRLGHIISVVSWSHWVFRGIQQAPSSRRTDRWLFFGLHLLFPVCRRLCSGSDWRTPDCPPPLAYTWSSTRSSDNPRPAPVTFPSFFLEPAPSSPPMELSAPARLVVLWPLRPRLCQVSVCSGCGGIFSCLSRSTDIPQSRAVGSKPEERFLGVFSGLCPSLTK